MSENLKTILLGISAMVISLVTGFVLINVCRSLLEGTLEICLIVAISIVMSWNVLKQIPWIIKNSQK